MYHGTKRAAEVESLTEADVVLTTYSTLESEHRKVVQPGKVTCGYCNKQFYPERLRVHLKCAFSTCACECLLQSLWSSWSESMAWSESEDRKVVQPRKVTCGYCNKQFYPERLRVHLKCALSACPCV